MLVGTFFFVIGYLYATFNVYARGKSVQTYNMLYSYIILMWGTGVCILQVVNVVFKRVNCGTGYILLVHLVLMVITLH